jgi:hypothetical protein
MKNNVSWLLGSLGLLLLVGCQPMPAQDPAVTVVVLESATPEPTKAPTETATPQPLSGERQHLEGYFSFIASENYTADVEDDSVFISDEGAEIFISFAIIGAGQDERSAQGLVDSIFAKFEGHEIQTASVTQVGGLVGSRADFSGVLSGTVVSGNYVIVDLDDGVSFFAFGMGNVSESNDTWQGYGRMDFEQMLDTVEIFRTN